MDTNSKMAKYSEDRTIASQENDVKLLPQSVPQQSEESGELQIYVKIVEQAR